MEENRKYFGFMIFQQEALSVLLMYGGVRNLA